MLYILSIILTNKNKEDSAFGAANEGGRLEGVRVDRQKAVDIELGWQNHSLSPYFLPHQWQRMWLQVIVDNPMRPGPALRKNTHYCIEPKSQKSPGEWRSPKVQCLGQTEIPTVSCQQEASLQREHEMKTPCQAPKRSEAGGREGWRDYVDLPWSALFCSLLHHLSPSWLIMRSQTNHRDRTVKDICEPHISQKNNNPKA